MYEGIFISTNGHGISRAARNGQGSWSVTQALESEDVRCLAADPSQPGVVYAGTQGNGVLRSDDGGSSWRPAGLAGTIVKSVAVSQSEPGTVYAGSKSTPRIFVSRDGGGAWSELEGFRRVKGRRLWLSPAEPPFTGYVQSIGLSPTDPKVIVAGIEAGAVVRSSDGGVTWSGHRKGALRDCHTMLFHHHDGRWIYEAGGGGAAVSQDGGERWQRPKAGLDRRYGWACAADPGRPEVWYVSASALAAFPKMVPAAHVDGAANAAIYRSSGGAAWERLGGGLPQPLAYMAYALVTVPGAPGHLYAGLSNGDVWHSADYGDSWRQIPFNLGGIHRVLVRL